jgi:nucleoside-diphosphate-sugar epimerase
VGSRIFLAGASGAIGRRLIPLLCNAGHHVTGTTRSLAKVEVLRELGADPVVVDVFDVEVLGRVITSTKPDIVIHQLTDLPDGLDPTRMAEALPRNARIRDEGTRNLVNAAIAAGARRFIAQSIAWVYATGPLPHQESDPLDTTAGINVAGVIALERQTLHAPPLEGVVLRCGQLYGPGTGFDMRRGTMPLHVDAAAYAAFLAVDKTLSGIFNIAEPNEFVATEKAQKELGWHSNFRLQT